MDEKNNLVNIIEEPVTIYADVASIDTDLQEEVAEVNVQDEALPFIEAEDVDAVDIEMEEAFPFVTTGALDTAMNDKDVLLDGGIATEKNNDTISLQELLDISAEGGAVSHTLLHGREMSNQHPISAISDLEDRLNTLGAAERVYSSSNGLGEFRRWHDGNPKGENRSGYFVSIVPGTDEIEICDATHDVYGISVNSSGFIGSQNTLYQKGQEIVNNYDNSTSYAIVGIVGAMRVRTDGKARNGDYVVPNEYGEATLSDNNYGYKVLSQGSYPSYEYVTIGITPQSDALSRLQSSVAGGDLGDILIKIENVENGLGDLDIKVDASKEDIEDILGEIGDLQIKVTTAEDVANAAKESAESAKQTAIQAAAEANQAAQDARDAADGALNSANQALSDAMGLRQQLQPVLEWSDDEGLSSGAQGFVTQADADHALLASLIVGDFPDGTNLAAIIQKVDKNGAMIQHLVSHIDKYSVGLYSVTYGLTYNEARSILSQEHIYVPTITHEEVMDIIDDESGEVVGQYKFTFEKPETHAYSYKWIPFKADDSESGKWERQERIVPTVTTYIDEKDTIDGTNKLAVDDLCYCKDDITNVPDGMQPLKAENLYIWNGYMWDWVASADSNYQSRIITSMRQTDQSIISDVVALDGRATGIEQNVNSITTRVNDAEGNISTIKQEVGDIQSTISTINGNISSLQQHADETTASFTAITMGTFPQKVLGPIITTPPEPYNEGKKYTMPPTWDDDAGIFVFDESYASDDGVYYFDAEYSQDQTKYCYVSDDGYYIYTVGKEVTAMIDNRITENEASINTLVAFKEETAERVDELDKEVQTNTESIAGVEEKANKNEASITSLASRYYHAMLSVSKTEVPVYGENKYTEEPTWNSITGKYEFDNNKKSEDGNYYMVDENSQSYCKVVTQSDGTVLYETYGLVGGSIAAVQQKVDANSSSIGLVVERVENVIDEDGNLTDESISGKGSIIIEAINGESTAQIEADRVNIAASKVFSAIVDNGTITPASIVAAINNSESSVKIGANHVSITADDIDFTASKTFGVIVGDDGVVDPEKIVTAINATDSSVIISAEHLDLTGVDIDMTGYVTLYDLEHNSSTKINGDYITTGKIKAKYLDLYGLTVTNIDTNAITFAVSDKGEVTINAKVTMGAGSTIDWGTVSTKDSSTDGIIRNPSILANLANINAGNAETVARKIARGEYAEVDLTQNTFISGTSISSPNIYGGLIYGANILWGNSAALGCLSRTKGDMSNPDGTITQTDLVHMWTTDGIFIEARGGGLRLQSSNGIYLQNYPANVHILKADYGTYKEWYTLPEWLKANVSSVAAVFG